MSQSSKAQWIIKNADGIVRGPYDTEKVLQKISQGELTGDEQISLYPNSDWHPISKDPQFYDKLLEFLEGDKPRAQDSSAEEWQPSSASKSKSEMTTTPKPTEPVRNRAERVKSTKVSEEPTTQFPKTPEKDIPEVIELKKLKKVKKRVRAKKSIMPVLLILAALAAAAYFMLPETSIDDDRVRLLAPQKATAQKQAADVQAKMKEGVSYFQRDDLQGYLAAQNAFVQAFESNNRDSGVLGFLCVTYLELWPHAFQDSQDLQTILWVNQLAAKIDSVSAEAVTCKAVDLLIRGRYVEARSVTETALETHGQNQIAQVMFYYFKAKLLEANREFESAFSYVRSAQQAFPNWLRLYSYEGSLLIKLNRYEDAAKRFRQILQLNPQHATSLVEMGLIEAKHFKNVQQAETLLRQGLSSADKAPREVTSRGFLGLSEIALQRGDMTNALKFAQNSYALNSTNERAKQIIVQIGGDKKLRETKVLDLQLVYEGDQLSREGDCSAAQAHYKAAFEVNPRNGVAAMKAAECLWNISLTSDAIEWLNRAIRADANLIDAYIMQADFFSQRFNFSAATKVLGRANQVKPNHYKVFRGLALVELRRLNAKGAVTNAERALNLYDADVDSYVILAKALIQLREHSKAFTAASKATEIDINNRQAQIVYAEALGGVQGMPAAIESINRLVNIYPMITEYRIALGDLYMKDQSYPAAETVYDQVTRIESKPKEAYLKLGKARQAMRTPQKYDQALDAYLRAAEIDPSDPEPLLQAGLLYLELKQPIEAQSQFNRVLRINRDYPLVNYYMGRAALMNGAAEEALKAANEEKQRNPSLADPYLLAADAYVELEQYTLCATEYQQALKLRPQGALIYIKSARCFRLSGNLDAATSMINTAANQESGEPEVYKEQGAIFEARGDSVKAIGAYEQYLVLSPNAPDRAQIQMRIQTLSR